MIEMEANILIFALIMINIILIVWVRIPFLQLFAALITVVMASIINGSSVFPWLNIMLILVALYSMLATYKNTK